MNKRLQIILETLENLMEDGLARPPGYGSYTYTSYKKPGGFPTRDGSLSGMLLRDGKPTDIPPASYWDSPPPKSEPSIARRPGALGVFDRWKKGQQDRYTIKTGRDPWSVYDKWKKGQQDKNRFGFQDRKLESE